MAGFATDVAVIGAGPYGLALASHLRHLGIEHMVVGRAMSFWREHMPRGMALRSSWDWHLDPQGVHTMERFLGERGLEKSGLQPLPLEVYLAYAAWFQDRESIAPLPYHVECVVRLDSGDRRFRLACSDGTEIAADRVVLCLGFAHCALVPADIVALIPAHRMEHTHDFVDFSRSAGRRFLIVGGRQSAYEWAALLVEAGAASVHLTHRHPSPRFAEADWSWVGPIVEGMIDEPGWFRTLTADERDNVSRRLWGEGRLKVEPWLEPRLRGAPVTVWPETRIVGCSEQSGGELKVRLDNGAEVVVDQVVLATGYKPDLGRVELLGKPLRERVAARDGVPDLDETFQTSVPGLYCTSMLATGSFGPFFAFTVAARASARIIGAAFAGQANRR